MSFEISYKITDSKTKEVKLYQIDLNEESMRIEMKDIDSPPDWTKLSFHQCDNCSLKEEVSPYCPIAVNLAHLVEDFKDMISYTQVEIEVTTPDRVYCKKTDLQSTLQSIFGVIMAASGCPIMDYFRPMARFHLPCQSIEEQVLRVVSFHLMREYFKQQNQQKADFSLDSMNEIYKQVRLVNSSFTDRISAVTNNNDAERNAIISLHTLGEFLSMQIDDDLNSIESYFA